jgi:4-amino-4-deoxy-L-arabinose transferase-like glycosyltransferase
MLDDSEISLAGSSRVHSIGLPRSSSPDHRRPAARLGAAALLTALGVFVGFDIASHPIVLWDESRLAVNALEMSQRGFSLVTTYGFQPDLWNTKPPLLIWLEAGSIHLFGASEWALRLPSFMAALATLALVMRFSWWLGGSRFVAAAAPTVLALSPGFFGDHAAQSGDYEALLCLFTTAYLLLLFRVLHRKRPGAWSVLACGLLVAGACLTKGIAGLAPGVGVAIYVIVRGRWPRLVQTPWFAVAGALVVAIVGGYYLAREQLAPGYLAAVRANELGARYVHGMNGHFWPAYYYLDMLGQEFGPRWAYVGLAVAPFLRFGRNKSAAFMTYAFVVIPTLVLVFSLSRTKIFWYVAPVYPLLSITFAIAVERVLHLLVRRARMPAPAAYIAVAIGAGYLVLNALHEKLVVLPKHETNDQGGYGELFAALNARGVRQIQTIDAGVYNNDDLEDYTPQRRFYTLLWRARGLEISEENPNDAPWLAKGQVLATCDPTLRPRVSALGPSVADAPGCVAVAGSGGG